MSIIVIVISGNSRNYNIWEPAKKIFNVITFAVYQWSSYFINGNENAKQLFGKERESEVSF